MIKKQISIFVIILTVAGLYLLNISAAFADVDLRGFDPLSGTGCGGSFANLLHCFWQAIFWIALSLAVLMFLVAAFLFLTSSGDPQKLEMAKGALLWAGIGLGLVIISGGLVFIICDVLGAACE